MHLVIEPSTQHLDQGISCELTQLTVRNDVWWSTAFEMVAQDDNQIDRFEGIVSKVSKTYQGPQLVAENSYAYSRWLSLLT